MFRENTDHLQTEFFNTVEGLPEKEKKQLADSWAQTFYAELFCRIDEAPFAKLYSGIYSRPNTPVNILAGIEILKAGYGWSNPSSGSLCSISSPQAVHQLPLKTYCHTGSHLSSAYEN